MSGTPSDQNGSGKQTCESDASKPPKIDNPMLRKLLNISSPSSSLPREVVGGFLPFTSQRAEGDNASDVQQGAGVAAVPVDQQGKESGASVPDDKQEGEAGVAAPDDKQEGEAGVAVPDDKQGKEAGVAVPDDKQGKKAGVAVPDDKQGKEAGAAVSDEQQGREAGVAVPDDQGAEVDHVPETQKDTEIYGESVPPEVQTPAADVDRAEMTESNATEVVPDAAAVPGKDCEVGKVDAPQQSPERMQAEGAAAENFKKPTVSSRIQNTKKRLEGMKLGDEIVPESSPRRSARLNKELKLSSELTPASRTRGRMSRQSSTSSNSELEGSGDETAAKRASKKKDPKK